MKKRKFISRGTFHVYILQCLDGTYYTGHTNDIARRLRQHKSGKGGAWYTKMKGASELAWCKKYRDFKTAFLMERRIKKLTRSEKELLVSGKKISKLPEKARMKLSGRKKDKINKSPARKRS